jgi:type IV pilus assembly protein PilB
MPKLQINDEELRTLLVDRLEILDHAELDKARRLATRLRIPLERALADRGRVPYIFLLEHLAEAWNVDFIDLKPRDVKLDALKSVPQEYARTRGLIPFQRTDGELRVAMVDPRDRRVIEEVTQLTRLTIKPHLAPASAIDRALLLYKGDMRDILTRTAAAETATAVRAKPGEDASAVELVNQLLEYAFLTDASDIHIEPFEFETLVRLRIDGVLHEVISLAPASLASLVTRIKVLSGLRIDERRVPQDGRFEGEAAGNRIDLRVSVLPSFWGEKIVLRVLQKRTHSPDLEVLGFSPDD